MTKKQGKILVDASTFRITRSGDNRCWIYEEWHVGGIDRKTGNISQGNWHTVGYYGQLSDLAKYMLNRQTELPEGTLATQIKDLLTAIKEAEARIIKELKEKV